MALRVWILDKPSESEGEAGQHSDLPPLDIFCTILSMKDLVCVKIFSSRIKVEVARGVLEAHNIKSIISADNAGGMRLFPFQYSYGVEQLVSKKDLKNAQEVLKSSMKFGMTKAERS